MGDGTFERASLVVLLGTLAVLTAEIRFDIPGVGLDSLFFVSLGAFGFAFVLMNLQTLATPTPGRVLITGGFVGIGVTYLGYLPPIGYKVALAALVVGSFVRRIEFVSGMVST